MAMKLRQYPLHIGQSETKPFHIMTVARRYPIKLIEYLLQILLPDTYTVIGYHDLKSVI